MGTFHDLKMLELTSLPRFHSHSEKVRPMSHLRRFFSDAPHVLSVKLFPAIRRHCVQVKKALNSRRNFELTAVKIVDRVRAPRDYQEKFMPRELALWPRLRHPNLIRFLDYFEDNQRVYMVMTVFRDNLWEDKRGPRGK